ncbi:hypothetical protein G6011_00598 [Alternaria panax]|uniref:Uncharacterized protein n=1 Tax=Alternaria panax TaxID=48097 RepID=A0AAD4IIH2_9PLEO|nr:hypothetical protein G6011_00598 [Alternaria panax]
MSPENISTGGYWKEDPTDAPHKDVETDFETGESSQSEPPTSHKKVTTSDNPEDNLVTVSHDSTPSPTASNILLKFPLEDTMEAQDQARQWWEQGLSSQESKRRLTIMLESIIRDRNVKEASREEEMKKEYEDDEDENCGDGKGKDKKV